MRVLACGAGSVEHKRKPPTDTGIRTLKASDLLPQAGSWVRDSWMMYVTLGGFSLVLRTLPRDLDVKQLWNRSLEVG